jgi:hypothetical protein
MSSFCVLESDKKKKEYKLSFFSLTQLFVCYNCVDNPQDWLESIQDLLHKLQLEAAIRPDQYEVCRMAFFTGNKTQVEKVLEEAVIPKMNEGARGWEVVERTTEIIREGATVSC